MKINVSKNLEGIVKVKKLFYDDDLVLEKTSSQDSSLDIDSELKLYDYITQYMVANNKLILGLRSELDFTVKLILLNEGRSISPLITALLEHEPPSKCRTIKINEHNILYIYDLNLDNIIDISRYCSPYKAKGWEYMTTTDLMDNTAAFTYTTNSSSTCNNQTLFHASFNRI